MSKRWYVLHARSGYEAKVKVAIEESIERENLTDLLSNVMIPTEQVVELKDGQKKTAERKFFPGYMLIHNFIIPFNLLITEQPK
jgi:transcriptional antiterminator NusG